MVRKKCIGALTQKVYIEDEEAAIHRYLNKKYSQSLDNSNPNIKMFLPEPLMIKRARKENEADS